MHELSIAMSIVRIAEQETAKANAKSVSQIELQIGTLAGIELEALEFAWPSAIKGSVLENAKKTITTVNGEAQCNDCQHVFALNNIYEVCPNCGSYLKTITKGKELTVKSMEVI